MALTDTERLNELRDLINDTSALDVTAKTELLPKDGEAASIQQLPGEAFASPWINGGGVAEMPFAVLRRTEGDDTAGRIGASAELSALGTALESATMPDTDFTQVKATDTPALIERSDNGSEVWRATYMLEYVRSA